MFAKRVIVHQLVSALVLQTAFVVHATDILQGDSNVADQSFKQPIKEFCQGSQGRMYVGAYATGAQEYSVALASSNIPKFFPIAPQKVFTPSGVEIDNPLYNAKITHMGIMYGVDMASLVGSTIDRILAVTQASPANIYLIDSVLPNHIEQLALSGVKDASGIDTQEIIKVTSDNPFWIFGAVTDSVNPNFGSGNSGIALVVREQSAANAENSQTSLIRLRQIDAQLGKPTPDPLTRAALLNDQNSSVRIGLSAVEFLNNAVDIHWNADVGCLFTALNVHATGNADEGAQAIVLGKFIADPNDNNMLKLVFVKITPDSLFTTANNIVGAIGNDVSISIHQAVSLYTSTVVNYLVILGGVGTSATTQRNVYALPIVKNQDDPRFNGMLASKYALPVTFYHSGCPTRVANRGFIQPAIAPDQLFTENDAAIKVGNGQMTEGDITSIMVYGDAVYAVVSETDAAHRPGVFYSQALFDSFGRIKCWTRWARVSGNFYDHCYGIMLDRISGNLNLLIGADANSIQTVKRTTWSSGDAQGMKNLVTWFNTIFTGQNGGIQGLSDVPFGTPGLKDISLLVAVGLDHVALAQTGNFVGGTLIPLGGTTIAVNPQRYTNGTINTLLPANTNAIEISGGELQNLGALTSSAITRVDNNGYLFVGGISGLAILTNAAGYSWDAVTGLGNNLTGLTLGLAFKKIGSFSQIRKLIADHDHKLLYVLSDSQLVRLDLQASNFATGELKVTTLADTGNPPFTSQDTFHDVIASRSLCLLGTSTGLYINGPTVDVRQAQSVENMQWQSYHLPEQLCTAQQLFGVSVDYTMSSLTTGTGGNIYVLDTQASKNRAVEYRLTINTQTGVPGVPYSVEMFPDLFIKDQGSYFVAFNGYRNWVYTNGALFFECLNRTLCMDPLLALLNARVRTAVRFGGTSHEVVPINLSSANVIQPLIRSSASGALLLAQNNVLSVNE